MAGYFDKLNGRVYECEHEASVDLENGTFVVIDDSTNKVVKSSANTNVELLCIEKTDIWGLPALRLRCQKEDGTVFMVEGDPTVDALPEYDDRHHVVKQGELTKMRSPHISDEIRLEVNSTIYTAAAVGDVYNVAANGLIAKKA